MGWTPRRDGEDPAADAQRSPSRTTRRRRRIADEKEQAETPNLRAARLASPRVSTGLKPKAGKRYDTGTISLRIQIGNRWSEIITAVKAGEYTWQEFCDGLDEEELARAQLRADDGSFIGRPPQFVPREFLLACQREQKRRFEEIFGSEVIGLAKTYIELCKDASIPPKDRAKLLQYAMERVFGGIPKDVRVSQEQPWEQMIVNVVSDGDTGTAEHLRRRYDGYAERLGAPIEGEDNGDQG